MGLHFCGCLNLPTRELVVVKLTMSSVAIKMRILCGGKDAMGCEVVTRLLQGDCA